MEEGWELQDWELLQNPESGMSLPSDSSEASRNFEGIGEEEGEDSVITSDYFALDSEKRYAKKVAEVEESSVESENPSWVDPSLGLQRKNSSEFWSDSGSDGSGSQKFREPEGRDEVGSPKIEDELKREVGFDGAEESRGFQGERVDFGKFWSKGDSSAAGEFKGVEEGIGEIDNIRGELVSEKLEVTKEFKEGFADFERFWSNFGGDSSVGGVGEEGSFGELGGGLESGVSVVEARGEMGSEKIVEFGGSEGNDEEVGEISSYSGKEALVQGETEGAVGDGVSEYGEISDGSECNDTFVEAEGGDRFESTELIEGPRGEAIDETVREAGEGEKKGMVWWKLPFEVLKFCVFRVSPVWSISIAAAVMGFVILKRRLHRMQKKTRSIPLNVTVEDKDEEDWRRRYYEDDSDEADSSNIESDSDSDSDYSREDSIGYAEECDGFNEEKVSQFMIRAARLNEAFSVVRRVPIIRPSLPANGVTPWPVMSLR